MESFGLFDLLKSMLLFKDDRNNSACNPTQSNPPATPTEPYVENFSPPKKVENSVAETTQKESATDAYLNFLQRHDELSKRRKKK